MVSLALQRLLRTGCVRSASKATGFRMPHRHQARNFEGARRTARILSPYSNASSSMSGAIIRQGPHQGAQKSTSTGTGDLRTSSSKVASVTAPAAQQVRRQAGSLPGIHRQLRQSSMLGGACSSARDPLGLPQRPSTCLTYADAREATCIGLIRPCFLKSTPVAVSVLLSALAASCRPCARPTPTGLRAIVEAGKRVKLWSAGRDAVGRAGATLCAGLLDTHCPATDACKLAIADCPLTPLTSRSMQAPRASASPAESLPENSLPHLSTITI